MFNWKHGLLIIFSLLTLTDGFAWRRNSLSNKPKEEIV